MTYDDDDNFGHKSIPAHLSIVAGDQAKFDETDLYYEMVPFDQEIEVYKNNILKAVMNIVGTEIMRLTENQQVVLLGLFYQEQTTRALGAHMGVTHKAIQETRDRALQTLRRRLQKNPYFIKLHKKLQELDPKISTLVAITDFIESGVDIKT